MTLNQYDRVAADRLTAADVSDLLAGLCLYVHTVRGQTQQMREAVADRGFSVGA